MEQTLTEPTLEWKDLPSLKQQIAIYTEQAKDLTVITPENYRRAGIYTGACRVAEKWIDETRLAKTEPLRKQVQEINDDHNAVKADFETLRKRIEASVGVFLTEQKRIEDEKQRLANLERERIERENQERLRIERENLERAEAAARIAQEQSQIVLSDLDRQLAAAEKELLAHEEAAPENMSPAYQKQLLARQKRVMELRMQKAGLPVEITSNAELDAKREAVARLESAAAMPVIGEVVEQTAKKIQTAVGSVSFKDMTTTWNLNGWDKLSKKPTIDVVEPAVLKTLPAEIQWLLKVSILDAPALNASFKARETFPKPFGIVPIAGSSTTRSKRSA